MTWEIICDNCGKVIPEGMNFIEYDNNYLVFCNEDCEVNYYNFINHLEKSGDPGDDLL